MSTPVQALPDAFPEARKTRAGRRAIRWLKRTANRIDGRAWVSSDGQTVALHVSEAGAEILLGDERRGGVAVVIPPDVARRIGPWLIWWWVCVAWLGWREWIYARAIRRLYDLEVGRGDG